MKNHLTKVSRFFHSKGMKKGQLFSLDALLALLAVTLALGLIITQTEALYLNSPNELQTMASDWSQIAVKKTLAFNAFESNNLSSSKLSILQAELNAAFGTTHNYEAELYGTGFIDSIQNGAGCTTAKQVSIIKRPCIVDGEEGYLLMKVCKNEA